VQSTEAQKNPPGGGLHALGSLGVDLLRAQLHLPGTRRMMMAHVVDANEHDGRA
jgi:hypothetical protein